jgi:hypothetical protein
MRDVYRDLPNNFTPNDLREWIVDVTRKRQFDLDDFDNQVAGNAVIFSSPSTLSDIRGGEKPGDIAVDASNLYVVVDNSGTLEWLQIGGSGGGTVNSVNGQTGVVVLDSDDIAEGSTNLYYKQTFETVSKNISSWDATISYSGGVVSSISYSNGVLTVVKTFNYTGSDLTSIVLSGDTPAGIDLTKTLSYTSGDLTGIAYS